PSLHDALPIYEDVLVGQFVAGPRQPRVNANAAHALLLRPLEVLERARSEGSVGGAPAPHDDQPRVDVVDRLAAGALVVSLRTVGDAHREDFGLRRDVRPQLRAAAEHVEQALDGGAAVEHGEAARARAVEDRRRPVSVAHAQHLASDLVERLVPPDALELAGAPRAHAP